MENNKSYLQKIHWVFLIGAVYALFRLYIWPEFFLNTSVEAQYQYLFTGAFNLGLFYSALGVITSKWKEAAIAFGTALAIILVEAFTLKLSYNLTSRLVLLLVYSVPPFIFVALQTTVKEKLWQLFIITFFLSLAFSLSFYSQMSMKPVVNLLSNGPGYFIGFFLIFTSATCFFVFEIIAICEVINYMQGKNYTNKATLLNLGNDFNKLNSILTFWAVKVATFMIIISAAAALNNYIILTGESRQYEFLYNQDPGLLKYYQYTGILNAVSFAGLALFAAWYLRKFLIETFISYGIHSKFLYWLSLLPVIGFLTFLIVQFDTTKRNRYHEKMDSLGSFASSSTTAVTGVFFLLIIIRLLLRLTDGDRSSIIGLGIAILLFIWMISSKTGYYAGMIITALGIVTVTVLSFVMDSGSELTGSFAVLYGLLLLQLVQLILIYPVYHFEEFQYIPAEDPDLAIKPEGETQLFPEYGELS